MKNFKNALIASGFIIALILTPACSGDDGAIGPEGPQGLQGLVGAAGADGSVIYSDEGLANDNTGQSGDYYFDITTGTLYGPKKSDDSWADADSFVLKGNDGDSGADGVDGADGTNGKDGATILSGKGLPALTLGNIGDYYLDISSYTLYGPKSASLLGKGKVTWGAGIVLRGADGNANVKTFRFTVDSHDWIIGSNTTSSKRKTLSFEAEMPSITEDMYTDGMIMVYEEYGSINKPYPYIFITAKGNTEIHEYHTEYSFDYGCVVVVKQRRETFVDATEVFAGAEDVHYKVVFVQGQAASELKSKNLQNITLEEINMLGN